MPGGWQFWHHAKNFSMGRKARVDLMLFCRFCQQQPISEVMEVMNKKSYQYDELHSILTIVITMFAFILGQLASVDVQAAAWRTPRV